MLDPTLRKNVTPGSTVRINTSEDPQIRCIETGIIKRILSQESFCKDGVLVELKNGLRGTVDEIISYVPTIHQPDLEVIANGESHYVEFKSSLAFNYKRFQTTGETTTEPKLEFNIPKTIAGFANANGGTLYIGVNDQKEIIGLKYDYKLLNLNPDKFELKIHRLLDKYFKQKVAYQNIDMTMLHIENNDVFKINVVRSNKPFIFYNEIKYLDDNGHESILNHPYFYVRVGNSTQDYQADDFFEYWNEHIKKI